MKEQDPILADELSRRIAAEIQGKDQPPVSEAIEKEAELAAELISLAHDTHPDPDFVAALGSQLARRAAQKKKVQRQKLPPERPSFWQQLSQMLKEGTTMNRNKYLLGALGAVVVIVIAAFIFMNRDNNTTEPGATIAEDTTSDISNDNTTSPTTEAEEDAVEIAGLPPLPVLEGNQTSGLGGGGAANVRPQSGGGGFTEGAAFDANTSILYTDPFSGTTFTLNTTLPTDTTLTTVLQNVPDNAVTVEQARDLATRFGFTSQLYREQYPVFEETIEGDRPAYEPPVVYHVFDGPRSLIIDAWGAYYNDLSIENDFENPIPFEQAVPIAEAFVQEHNLIDFEYEVQQIWGSDVNFVRLVDGQPVNQPELSVGVSHDGRIFFVSYQVLRNAETLGRYPLISAEAAWELLQGGVVENGIIYNYSVGPEFAIEQPIPIEPGIGNGEDAYQFWVREYEPGDEVHLYEWPLVYLPVDSDADPRIQIRNYILEADRATLDAIAAQVGQQIHLWGQIGANDDTIQVTGWEEMGQINQPIAGPGVIRLDGEQVLFTNNETGETYIIPEAPVDLEDGLNVYLFAWVARDLGQAYPVADWENIEKVVEPLFPVEPLPVEEPEAPIEGPVDGGVFEPFTYESFSVDEVSIAYYYTYNWPTNENGETLYEGQPTIIVQPTWKFSGQTDTGEYVDFFVQAVDAEHLQR